MASLRAILGLFPKTADIEAKRADLEKEYAELNAFLKSDVLKEYNDLKSNVPTSAFARRKKEIKNQSFKNTQEYVKEQEYKRLSKDPEIKNYLKVKDSQALNNLKEFESSAQLKEYQKLEKILQSQDFLSVKKYMALSSKKKFEQSDLYKDLKQYEQQKNSSQVKNYYKSLKKKAKDLKDIEKSDEIEAFEALKKHVLSEEFKRERKKIENSRFKDTPEFEKETRFNELKKSSYFRTNLKFKASKSYNNYLKTEGSEKLTRYENSKEIIQSEPFIKVKEYMNLSGSKKYELSEEYKKEQRYKELEKSEKIKWYKKLRNTKKFDVLKQWELTFDEDFNSDSLNKKKWLTKYFWGETILHDTYSLAHEKQYFSDGKNLEIKNSVLKIVTRIEKASGKAWNPQLGFFPKEFNYTSGIINTGNFFRQKYGIFEAKIRFNESFPVNHAFWMISEHILPHIDIAKAQKKLTIGNMWGNIKEKNGVKKHISKLSMSKFSRDFFIYRLEWTKDKLTWKINGVTVASSSDGVPQVPMYVVLSSSLYNDVNGTVLPAAMEVDWVKCYQAIE